MVKRGFLLLSAVIMAAVVAGATVVGMQSTDGTPPAGASPVASPQASPMASPVGSPVSGSVLPVGDVERGRQLAAQCLGCHTTDGSPLVGPSWKGLYGKTEMLESGETVVVDDAYLHQSIVDPLSQVVQGYPPAMPPYNYLTEQQIADLIAYIKSLQ